jgi:hypothetical protein
VASSSSRIGASFKNARAMAMRYYRQRCLIQKSALHSRGLLQLYRSIADLPPSNTIELPIDAAHFASRGWPVAGLALAAELRRRGIETVTVDKVVEGANTTDRMTRMTTLRSPAGRARRNVAIGFAGHIRSIDPRRRSECRSSRKGPGISTLASRSLSHVRPTMVSPRA